MITVETSVLRFSTLRLAMRRRAGMGALVLGWSLACSSGSGASLEAGDAAFEREDYPAAIAHFDAVIEADPANAEAWLRRGLSKYFSDDFDGAHADLLEAQRLDSELPNLGTYIQMAERKR